MMHFKIVEKLYNYHLGKLFRSVRSLSNTFSTTFPDANYPIGLDETLLDVDWAKHIDFAKELYQQYKYEMLEIIGSYGFSNEIDLFCCVESRNMNANERSDTQQTVQKLVRAVFQHIRNQFRDGYPSVFELKAKAGACYYVAYTDEGPKDKRMLSFPWLFASQLLADHPIIFDDEEANDFMESTLSTDCPIYQWLLQQNLFSYDESPNQILETWFQNACDTEDEQWINIAEMFIKELIKFAKATELN